MKQFQNQLTQKQNLKQNSKIPRFLFIRLKKMFLFLQCCEKCFSHKQYSHNEWVFYQNYCKLEQVIARKCRMRILKNLTLSQNVIQELEGYDFAQKELIDRIVEEQKQKVKPEIGSFQLTYNGIKLFSLLETGQFPEYSLLAKIVLVVTKISFQDLAKIGHECKQKGLNSIYELVRLSVKSQDEKNIKAKTIQQLLQPRLFRRNKAYTSKQKIRPTTTAAIMHESTQNAQQHQFDAQEKQKQKATIFNPNLKANCFIFNKRNQSSMSVKKLAANLDQKQNQSYKSQAKQNKTRMSQTKLLNTNNLLNTNKMRNSNKEPNSNKAGNSNDPTTKLQQMLAKKRLQKRIRCKKFSNRYSNLNKKTEIINRLVKNEYIKIKEEKYEYLSKESDFRLEQNQYHYVKDFELQELSDSSEDDEDLFRHCGSNNNRLNCIELLNQLYGNKSIAQQAKKQVQTEPGYLPFGYDNKCFTVSKNQNQQHQKHSECNLSKEPSQLCQLTSNFEIDWSEKELDYISQDEKEKPHTPFKIQQSLSKTNETPSSKSQNKVQDIKQNIQSKQEDRQETQVQMHENTNKIKSTQASSMSPQKHSYQKKSQEPLPLNVNSNFMKDQQSMIENGQRDDSKNFLKSKLTEEQVNDGKNPQFQPNTFQQKQKEQVPLQSSQQHQLSEQNKQFNQNFIQYKKLNTNNIKDESPINQQDKSKDRIESQKIIQLQANQNHLNRNLHSIGQQICSLQDKEEAQSFTENGQTQILKSQQCDKFEEYNEAKNCFEGTLNEHQKGKQNDKNDLCANVQQNQQLGFVQVDQFQIPQQLRKSEKRRSASQDFLEQYKSNCPIKEKPFYLVLYEYFSSSLCDFKNKQQSFQSLQSFQLKRPIQQLKLQYQQIKSIEQFFDMFYPCPKIILEAKSKKKIAKTIQNLLISDVQEQQQKKQNQSKSEWVQLDPATVCKIFLVNKTLSNLKKVQRIIVNTQNSQKTKIYLTKAQQQIQTFIEVSQLHKQYEQVLFLFYDPQFDIYKKSFQLYSKDEHNKVQGSTIQKRAHKGLDLNLIVKQKILENHKSQPIPLEQRSNHIFISFGVKQLLENQKSTYLNDCQIKVQIYESGNRKKKELIGEIEKKGSFFFQLNLEEGQYNLRVKVGNLWYQDNIKDCFIDLVVYSEATIELVNIKKSEKGK